MNKRMMTFEEFYSSEDFDEVNEAGGDIAEVLGKIKKYLLGATFLKKKSVEASARTNLEMKKIADEMNRTKERASKTQDPDQAKVYQAKLRKLGAETNMLQVRKKYQEAKIVFADAQVELANARMQKANRSR